MAVAIVTGSDSGIGRATAVALAEAGFDVGVTWHSDEAGARTTAQEVAARGRRAESRRLDLTQLPGAADRIDEMSEALTKVMALELAEHEITVNSVAPGEIATPMTGNDDVDPRRVPRPAIPMGRPGDAREIAAVIAFLASPDASYLTGASLVVDGGLLLMAAIGNQDQKPERAERPAA